jgi:hypothetical protein
MFHACATAWSRARDDSLIEIRLIVTGRMTRRWHGATDWLLPDVSVNVRILGGIYTGPRPRRQVAKNERCCRRHRG